jgi:glycolate oxidase iron-sulfur subunit
VALPRVTPARGERRAGVALLDRLRAAVLDPDINVATIEVLARNGVEVLIARSARLLRRARVAHRRSRIGTESFARRIPRCVSRGMWTRSSPTPPAAAPRCTSIISMLRGTADEQRAEAFRHRVLDVSVFLTRLGVREPMRERRVKVAYHDACHLANAQNVRREPRNLLRAIPGLDLIELPDAHLCCGSAGTYNLDQPEIAASLGEQKARAVMDSGAEIVASGNIGCLTQLRAHLARLGSPIRVQHTMQVLRDSLG